MGKGLIDEVFSWSLSDILDEELYKEKVEKIPDSFQAVDQYFASFVYPLLEETRAQLASSLEKVSRAPYAQVTYFDSTKQNGKLYYDIEVDYWRNRCGVDGERSYRTFAGDYFVFTDAKPEAVSDLPQLERGWALLSKITENKNGDGHTLTFLRVLSSKEIQVKLSSGRPLFIVFLMNMRTNERIWNSLQMGGNMNVIKQILCSPTQDEKNYALCRARGNCLVFEEYIRTLPSELNKSQRKVVVDILYRIECNHRSFVELILGPPGTGKTRTLSIFLYTLLRMNRRSLVCAPTDVAIAELASRVLKLVKESSEASYLLGRILYFGDQGLSGVNAHIGEIYMDHQVETLDSSSRLLTASLIFCTASSSYALHSVLANKLNLLIVDEAAQLKECELSIPLQLPGVRHSVLFGDHCQLSATVTSNASARAGFGRSLFERLISIGHSKHILDMQYRMHPLISLLPNSEFYGNQILDAPNVKNKRHKKCIRLLPLFGPYSFINVSCGREEMDSFTCSFKNMVEVAMVTKIIRKLFKAWGKSKEMLSVGIVATYTAQVIAIKEKVGQKYDSFDRFSLKVSTIDGFQGGEEDVIIFSTVRSNAKGSVGDISNRQRTNVALTRARCCLWIVGDGRTLFDSNTVWKSIVQDAKDRNCFYNAEEDEDLADVVLEVKKEMDQLDDFLNADSLLFKNARWKVLFSDNFRKSFEKLKSSETKKLILNLLLRLSCGWRPKRRSTNLVCDDFSQMLKQFKVKDLHIICSIDVVKDSCYIQVLKVWDILPLEDIPLLVDHLSTIFQSYTDEFIKRCKVKCLEGDLEVPKSWNSCISRYKRDCVQSGNNSSAFVESCKSSDSFLLMKFYALSAGVVSHLLSGCDGNEIDFLFELTEEEKDIIEFSGSSFILGRSGTGKTTVLIMKLVQKEQLYHLAAEGFHKVESNSSASSTLRKDNAGSEVEIKGNILRQIFVTVNVKLCYAVRQYISRLKRSMCGCNSSAEGFQSNLDDIDEASQFSDIPDSFSDIPRSSYPLVITFNKFLMMLDGTVGRSFFGRLLEFTGLSQEKRKGSRSMALKTFIRTKEVHYDKFCSAYWPHFSIQLTKKLDPSTIFAEIVSHIKGGSCVGVQDDKLSREDYISYSRRRLSHLSEQERGTIYDIFIQYEKKKKTRGEFDLSDFVIDLHHRLGDENYEGEKMDFVYVDEVQDLTMRQISLFKYICRNFEDGFVFSGDTAQTIVRGVDFRFKDIKALFYREFTACERNGKGQVSDIFNLSQNFRSHAGVLKLANSVLNLLYHFFPSSVDRLQPETSLVNGEEPVWVQMRNGENTLCSFFKGSGSFDRGIFGFGAEQVILVRDDSHRNEVLNYVGKQALVLTLTECKGLEFQDVLLYNFFSSSPLKDQWEVIYGYMKEQNLIDSPLLKSFPIFNEGKHISLCLELKQLYVAITRTRKRLWIFESRFCSMFNYWEKLHLVQIRELEYNFLQEIQVASSQREWKARGMKFFYQQNYDKARFCFEKAGESYLEKWAVAAGSVSTADQMRDSNPKMADIHLTEAAHIYESIGKNESAALCFFELREYEKAGIIYLEKCGESKLEEAGECFYSAGCYKRAAEIYARCNLFSKCLSACADGKLFEVGYDFIQLWKENKFLIGQGFLESEELQKFLERGALYFQKLQDSESMMKFVKDFQSENLMRTFLKSVDCLDELVLLEKERGNFLEAANVANMKGDILLGVDLLQMGRRFKEASGVILSYVLYNSLWVHGSKGWPLKQFEKKEELLIKAKTYAENVSQHYHNFVCIEADILSHGKSSLFTMEKNWGDSARHGSFRGKILGARKILDAYLYQGTPQHENEVYLVEDLIKYTQNKKSREKTSVGGIVYYWNFWKEEIENILSSIQDTKEDSYSEFCLNYFGVSKQLKNEKTLYLLLYPDAEWVKGANLRNIKRGNSIWIDADQFVWSAIRYWSSEMLTVGVKVLEILEAFYVFSVDNALSLNCKTMLLIEIFRVSKSLIESKFLNHRDSSNILQRFLEIPIKNFFGHIYPLDWRMPMTKDMIYLRDTELSRNLLREVVYRIIRSRAIANGQLGMLMTIILSGKFSTNLYMQIATTLGDNISWKEFIENFIQTKSNDNSIEDPIDFDLVVKFHRALADTEYTDFSPSVFLYLVDRLLILVSYLKGYFFTTKSSLVEWLMSRGWNTETNLDYLSDVQVQPLLEETVGFVAHTVNKLICSEPLKWIKRYNLKMEFYPLLVLRLFVVLCLLCINFDGYYDLLFNLLDKREVTSLLPWKFYKSLWRLREHEKAHINIKVVSEALKGIGNPLVVVNLGLHCAEFSFPGAIFLHLNVEQGRKCILQRLFLKNDMFSSNRARCSKLARKDSFGGGISLKINHQEIPSASSFVTTSDPVKAQQTNRNFWAMLGTVEFNPLTDASWLMEMILEYVLLVNATMRCCRRGNCCHSSGSAAGMVNKVCDELQQLYSALDSSEWEVQDNRIIRDLLKKLQLRRKRMEPLLDQLLICDSNKRKEHAALKTSVKDGDSGTAEKSSTGAEASNSTSC